MKYPTCDGCEFEDSGFLGCNAPDICVRYIEQSSIDSLMMEYLRDDDLDYFNFDEIDFLVDNYL